VAETDAHAARHPGGGIAGFLPRIFPALEHRDFRYLWLAQVSQASAMWMETVTRNWLTLELTGSALQLGGVNFVRAVPSLLIGPWAGVLADRFSKKKLLLFSQTWSLIVYAIMTWVVLSGGLELWHLYASTLALALGMSVSQPVRASYIPALVPQDKVIGALSLNATAMNGSRIIWPAIAGILAATNPGLAYLIATAFYLLLQLWTFLIREGDAPSPHTEQRSMAGAFGEGLRFVLRERIVLALVASRLGPITIASGFQVLIPVFAVQTLGMGAGAYGILLSAEGLGAIIGGTVIASRRSVPHQGLIALIAGSMLGLLILVVPLLHVIEVTMLVFVIIGISQITFQSANNAALFGQTPANLRGRVIGVRNQTRGLVPVSSLGAGALADFVGVSFAFTAVGGASLAVLWLVQILKPDLRKI
jgi:MFS family permease